MCTSGAAVAASPVSNNTIRVGIGQLPMLSESNEEGILVDMLRRLAEASDAYAIKLQVYPFGRSLKMLENDKVDVHFPFIYSLPIRLEGIRFSSMTIYKVPFVLVTNTDERRFSIDSLDPNSVFFQPDLAIETAYGHGFAFAYPMAESVCIECSVKKLARGRIDGVVFAAKEVEKIIWANHLSNIRVENYRMFDVKFLVKDNETGKAYEREISRLFRELHQRGQLASAMGPLLNYDIRGFYGAL